MKKLTIIITCLFIAICPCLTFCDFSYADAELPPSGYMPVLTEQQKVAAWKAYCASRNNRTIMNYVQQNTPLSVYEKYMYQKLQECAKDANVDLDQLSAEMYYNISNNDILSFWYTTSALNTLNMLFNVWLNKNNQDVNSPDFNTPNTENVYSGVTFETYDGDKCLAYIIDDYRFPQGSREYTKILSYGTPLVSYLELQKEYDTGDNHILINITSNKVFENNIMTQPMIGNTSQYLLTYNLSNYNNNQCLQIYPYSKSNEYAQITSQIAIVFFTQSRNFSCATLSFNRAGSFRVDTTKFYLHDAVDFNPSGTPQDTDIDNVQGDYTDVTYNNPVILITNNSTVNNFNNDYGDTVTIQKPKEKPSQKPVDPDSVTPDPNNPTINPGNPDFDFTMPNIDIDWNLDLDPDDLPFPFSIPNDIYHAFDSLNVEAEAPHFEGTVDLYICEWDIDIDFTEYSSLANIVNKWFLFVYVVGLIIATRSLMHIY